MVPAVKLSGILIALLLAGCYRGRADEPWDLIDECKRRKACDISDTFGAEARGWIWSRNYDACSLRCGCLFNAVPSLTHKDGLWWTDARCP